MAKVVVGRVMTVNGIMFREIAITGFVATVAAILLHFVVSKPKFDDVFGKDRAIAILDPLRLVVFFVTLLFVEQKWSLVGALRKLVFLLAMFCLCCSGGDGFIPRVIYGEAISSWWLMIHATMAPVFAACMAVLAVLWADKNRFDKNYCLGLIRFCSVSRKARLPLKDTSLRLKICFWGIFGFDAAGDSFRGIVSMFTIFGTHGQEVLLQIHRYSTLLFVDYSQLFICILRLLTRWKRPRAGVKSGPIGK